jgi:hypothetical protein
MHGPIHSAGRVLPADAVIVRDTIDAAKGYPSTTGQLRTGELVEDSWLQPSGETDGDGAPVLVRVTGGTQHWRQIDDAGELLVTHHEAAIVDAHGTERARTAVQTALLRGVSEPPGPGAAMRAR